MAANKPRKKVQKQLTVLKEKLVKDEKVIKQAKVAAHRAKQEAKAVEQKLKKKVRQTVKRAAKEIKAVEKKKVKIKVKKVVVRKKGTGTYQYFMAGQVRKGKSFKQGAKTWKKFKDYVETGKIPTHVIRSKPTVITKTRTRTIGTYQFFIAEQLRKGMTMAEAVKAWKKFKRFAEEGKVPTKIVRKTKVKVIHAKPKIITHTKVKTVYKPSPSEGMFKDLLAELATVKKKLSVEKPAAPRIVQEVVQEVPAPQGESEELQAFNLVKLYFSDVVRHGFKRQLDLDQVINAYLYTLGRVKRRETEVAEVMLAAKRPAHR